MICLEAAMTTHVVCSMRRRSEAGRGTVGCLVSLLLIGIVIFIGIRIGPPFYSNKSFEADINTEVSRAGAHFVDDETLANNIIDLARKNEIKLVRQQIKVERFAGQIHLTIQYTVPLDFIVVKRDWNFEIKSSSFVGRL
jgi:hypothetical protein